MEANVHDPISRWYTRDDTLRCWFAKQWSYCSFFIGLYRSFPSYCVFSVGIYSMQQAREAAAAVHFYYITPVFWLDRPRGVQSSRTSAFWWRQCLAAAIYYNNLSGCTASRVFPRWLHQIQFQERLVVYTGQETLIIKPSRPSESLPMRLDAPSSVVMLPAKQTSRAVADYNDTRMSSRRLPLMAITCHNRDWLCRGTGFLKSVHQPYGYPGLEMGIGKAGRGLVVPSVTSFRGCHWSDQSGLTPQSR